MRFVDPDGRAAETPFDAASLALGGRNLVTNVTLGNYGMAAVDALGMVLDGAAAVVPGVPGGAGVAITATRYADEVVAIADDALVVRGGAFTPNGGNSVEGIAANMENGAARGIDGFSAESRTGATLCELCTHIPQNQVGVTTAGEIRQAGGQVIPTPGRSPNHATVSNLSPEDANKLLEPRTNPVPKDQRIY